MGICCMTRGTQTRALWQAEGWYGEGDGREAQEGGDVCVPMAGPCWCKTEKPQNSIKQLPFNVKKKNVLYNLFWDAWLLY